MKLFCAIVEVEARLDSVAAFEVAMEGHIVNTRGEEGNISFYFLKGDEVPGSYRFFEVFVDRAAYDYHHITPHYLRWRAQVEPYMVRERTRTFWAVLEPDKK